MHSEQQIFDYLQQKFGIRFTEQQQAAVQTIDGPVLLLAVPGAGKTTVMVARIANMIFCHGIDPSAILTITFSKAGAQDMRRRYEGLFAAPSHQQGKALPQFCTIHSFCYQVLGSYCRLTGGVAPALIEPRERSGMLREIYQQVNGEFLSEDLEEELISNLSLIKNAMLRQQQVEDGKTIQTQIKNLWKLYQGYSALKKEHKRMDFDDMLGYALTVLKRYPPILQQYRQRYRYLCVDEAQDTSRLQYAVIGLLVQQEQNLFLVGDEDQSIYRFRGACPENLLAFPSLYPQAKVLKMEENFRSTVEIVSCAQRFIEGNRQRYQKKMFTNNAQGEPVEVKPLHDFSDQYHAAIDAYLAEEGTTAFIYRNNLSAVPMADILDRNDVDFYIKEHKTRLKSNYVVTDVLAFFSLSFDSSDFSAFSRIFYKTASCLKRNMLSRIPTSPLMQGESYFDRMVQLCDENQNTGRIRYIAMMIEKLRSMQPLKAMECILYQIGYLSYLEFTSGTGYSMQAQKLNILCSLAARVQTVEAFLDRIDELDEIVAQHAQRGEAGKEDLPSARLTLTTAHSAKGLEFDTVVLLDCMDDVFPAHSAVEKSRVGMDDEMEEEARLFYVAATRARRRLVIPTANFSANTPAVPSRFVARLTQSKESDTAELHSGGLRLYPGLNIEHKNFGRGQVVGVDRERGTFTVFFGKNGTRTLTMQILKGDTVRKV